MSEFAQDFHVDLTLKYHTLSFMYIEPMVGNWGGNSHNSQGKRKFSLMLVIFFFDRFHISSMFFGSAFSRCEQTLRQYCLCEDT